MKWLRYTVLALLSVVVIAGVLIYYLIQTKQPTYTGEKQLINLKASTKVVFDSNAVPHIYAKNDQDAFRTLGYVHASERLFQMDLLRRVGSGRLSELFGKDLTEIDALFRTLGLNEIAQQSAEFYFKEQDETYKRHTLAYLDGVNQYIRENNFPIEYTLLGVAPKEFAPVDLYHTVAYMGFSFAMALKTDPISDYIHKQLGPQYLNDLRLHSVDENVFIPVDSILQTTHTEPISAALREVAEIIPAPEFSGSNAWIVGAKKSKSGKPLFSNDTHIGYSQPCIWYEAHIQTPNLNLYGNYLAGFPFPLIGHTLDHAWGLTMLENDDFDLYREKIENNKVLYKGKWEKLKTRTETIPIKGEGSFQIEVQETPHGPIINNVVDGLDKTEPISAYWTMTKSPMNVLAVAHGMAFSKNINEFEKAISGLTAPGLNIMYADAKDNIAWWGAAKLLIRPNHVHSKFILDGSSGEDDPIGYSPFSVNPKSINPPSGYVYSANNQPASYDSTLYPGYYYPGNRAQIIMETLEKKDNWTLEEMKALQLHNTSPSYPALAQEILRQITPSDNIEQEVYNVLNAWDGAHNPTSVGPTIYYKLLYHTLHKTMADELGEDNFKSYLKSYFMLRSNSPLIANNSSIWWDNITTDHRESRKEILQAAFSQSVKELYVQLGETPKNWHWRNVHKVVHEHPVGKVEPLDQLFNVGPFPIDGGEEVVNKQSFLLNGDGYYKVKGGPAMRIVLDFNDIEHSESVLPTGQSGNPFSKYYQNQAQDFVSGNYRKQLMNAKEIDKEKIGTLKFTPLN